MVYPGGAGVAMFQSLSGFLMSCNAAAEAPPGFETLRFQSLSGFLMSCNGRVEDAALGDDVSIPIGFSNEL
mgnify:CR=1 FL=1